MKGDGEDPPNDIRHARNTTLNEAILAASKMAGNVYDFNADVRKGIGMVVSMLIALKDKPQ